MNTITYSHYRTHKDGSISIMRDHDGQLAYFERSINGKLYLVRIQADAITIPEIGAVIPRKIEKVAINNTISGSIFYFERRQRFAMRANQRHPDENSQFATKVKAIADQQMTAEYRIKGSDFRQTAPDSNHKAMHRLRVSIGVEARLPQRGDSDNSAIFDRLRAEQHERLKVWAQNWHKMPENVRFWDNRSENAYYEGKNG